MKFFSSYMNARVKDRMPVSCRFFMTAKPLVRKRIPWVCLCVSIVFLFTWQSYAIASRVGSVLQEEIVIRGKVSDVDSDPVVGVSVTVKGTKKTAITDSQGYFSITAPKNGVLEFTNIGYAPSEVSINGRSSIDVVLASELTALDEVVVIGYQTVRRGDLTGAVSSVGARELKDIP